jgi:low affinity Fe/Cu permease
LAGKIERFFCEKSRESKKPVTFYGYWMYVFSCLMIYILFYTGIIFTWTTVWGIYWVNVGIDLFLIFFTILLARFFSTQNISRL